MPKHGRKDRIGSVKTDPLYASDDFRMYCFKVVPCSRHYTHDWTECPFAHPGEKATRRDPRLYAYVGIECPHVKGESSKCPRGDTCPFAHNVFECWLHPTRYRTQMCNEPATCRRKICFFAHSTQEIREPTPVSKDMDLGLKQGPRRVTSTLPESKPNASSKTQHETSRALSPGSSASAQNLRASLDVPRKTTTVELPPRPSLDSSTSRLGIQTNLSSPNVSPSLSPQQPNNQQIFSFVAALQQQQQQEQRQMQMKSNPCDLTAALSQLALNTAQQQQQQPCLQPDPFVLNQLMVNGGQPGQLNELLSWYLQQQNMNNAASLLNPQQHVLPLNPSTVHINGSVLPTTSNALLLQQLQLQQLHQLQQAQSYQGIGTAGGLRSSLDSTQSNSSGRIPARISYDGVASHAPSVLQQSGINYLNMGSLAPGFYSGVGTPERTAECVFPGPMTRSSTDSSAPESYSCLSADTAPFDASLKLHSSIDQTTEAPKHLSATDDFIGLNQGADTFIKANANPRASAAES